MCGRPYRSVELVRSSLLLMLSIWARRSWVARPTWRSTCLELSVRAYPGGYWAGTPPPPKSPIRGFGMITLGGSGVGGGGNRRNTHGLGQIVRTAANVKDRGFFTSQLTDLERRPSLSILSGVMNCMGRMVVSNEGHLKINNIINRE